MARQYWELSSSKFAQGEMSPLGNHTFKQMIAGLRVQLDNHKRRCLNAREGCPCSAREEAVALAHEIFRGSLCSPITMAPGCWCTLTNMNVVHDPLVSRLPVELVSKIFEEFAAHHARRELDGGHLMRSQTTPLLLGAVCRRWREIAWATPRLWSSLAVNVYNQNPGLVQIVRDWLDRSRALPLYIHLYAMRKRTAGYRMSPPVGGEPSAAALIDAINAYSDRWIHLNLYLRNRYIDLVNSASARMLKSLIICVDYRDESQMQMFNAARMAQLEKLHIKKFDSAQLDIDWTHLKVIEGQAFRVQECYDIFCRSPSLEHFTLERVKSGVNTPPLNVSILRHDALTHLNLRTASFVESILGFLELPALTGPRRMIWVTVSRITTIEYLEALKTNLDDIESLELLKSLALDPDTFHVALNFCVRRR